MLSSGRRSGIHYCLSIGYLLIRFPVALMFAILLNEIHKKWWKKTVQTLSYLPHFISLVVVCGMVKELLTAGGPINKVLSAVGIGKIAFMSEPGWFDFVYIASGVWQALGWGTILYLTAMTGINTELYEAASMDGANRFQQIIHVTIPGILPTIMTLLIMDIGGIVNIKQYAENLTLVQSTESGKSRHYRNIGLQNGYYGRKLQLCGCCRTV